MQQPACAPMSSSPTTSPALAPVIFHSPVADSPAASPIQSPLGLPTMSKNQPTSQATGNTSTPAYLTMVQFVDSECLYEIQRKRTTVQHLCYCRE